MKHLLVIFLLLTSVAACAQTSKDTINSKKDTAFVPLFEKTDTLAPKTTIIYLAHDGSVRYTSGYVVIKGFLRQTAPGKFEWVKNDVSGYLNLKKEPIRERVIQWFEEIK